MRFERKQCPACKKNGGDTSQDNLAVYEDGHKHCFACGYHVSTGGKIVKENPYQHILPENAQIMEEDWRGIPGYVLASCGVLRRGNYIYFPYHNSKGEIMGVKKGKLDGSPVMGDRKRISLGKTPIYVLPGDYPSIVCEGEPDALSLKAAFPERMVIGLSGTGQTTIPEKLHNPWVVFMDPDKAGDRAREKLSEQGECWHVYSPNDKDVNDLLVEWGDPMLLREYVNEKVYEWRVRGIQSLHEHRQKEPVIRAIDAKLFKGSITTLAGETGGGKTTVALLTVLEWLKLGRRVKYFSVENSEDEVLWKCWGLFNGKFKGGVPDRTFLDRWTNQVYFRSFSLRVDEVVSACEEPNVLVVVDHVSALSNDWQELEEFCKAIKETCLKYNSRVLLLSQVTLNSNQEQISVYTIRGSKAIAHWSDIVALVGITRNKIRVSHLKNRWDELGDTEYRLEEYIAEKDA